MSASDGPSGPGAGRPVRVGIVGCGDVTEAKSGPAFRKLPGSDLTVVMRRDGAKAEDYARRHGVPRWTDDARGVTDADDVDLVYVATPPAEHARYVRMAAEAGKAVYVEKPMAISLMQAERMTAACRRARVPLTVAYYRRALPRFERVRQWIEKGAIGAPRTVRLTLATRPAGEAAREGWRFDPELAGGGLLMDLGSHQLDLLDHWLGPISEVDASARTRHASGRVEDEVAARFTFACGAHGVGVWNFEAATEEDEIAVYGSHGTVRAPVFRDGPVVLEDARGERHAEEIAHPEHVQQPLIAQVVGELRGAGGPCVSTGASASRTQGVLDALLHEHRRARARAE